MSTFPLTVSVSGEKITINFEDIDASTFSWFQVLVRLLENRVSDLESHLETARTALIDMKKDRDRLFDEELAQGRCVREKEEALKCSEQRRGEVLRKQEIAVGSLERVSRVIRDIVEQVRDRPNRRLTDQLHTELIEELGDLEQIVGSLTKEP